MDAITMLRDDHQTVEKLFKRFEDAGPRAHATKRDVVDRIIEELAVHAAVEEQLFYPAVRATVPDAERLALESIEEHDVVKWLLAELETLDPEHERFDAKVTVLIENVRHHVEEEESELFPMVRDALGRNALQDLGSAMEAAKGIAPTHPHPRSPDTPPGNIVIGTAAGIADRARDTVSGVVQGGAHALADLKAMALRQERPRRAARGTRTARGTAEEVRARAAEAAEATIHALVQARNTAEATLEAAKEGADRTATAARKGSTSTGRTARQAAKGTATAAKRSARKTASAAKRSAKAS